jgi:RNA polymerase sigma-70 factor (ECF subfamily)
MTEEADQFIPTRWSLLTRLKDWEDQASWKEFFDTYWKLIYAVAVKAGLSDAEAQEVVQETVITVAKKMSDFKTGPAFGSFKGWLLHVTRWRIADQIRKRDTHLRGGAARHSADTASTDTLGRVPDPVGLRLEALWNEEWEKNLIDAALERVKSVVNAKQYQIFYLHVIKKSPVQKVARTLGVNAAQVYLAKHRVGNLVKKEVERLRVKGI